MQETNEFAIFSLNDQEYGINIKDIRSIIKIEKITRVPSSPDFIDGVINLRGEIIPVANARKLLSFPPKKDDDASRIIIVEVGDYLIGMKVDKVYDIQTVNTNDIDTSKQLIKNFNNDFIEGAIKRDSRLIAILGIEQIFISA